MFAGAEQVSFTWLTYHLLIIEIFNIQDLIV